MEVKLTASGDRERLRTTFNAVAALYQDARPDYPPALYAELIQLAELKTGDRLLEIGAATGKATLPLAERGYRVTCIELGHELAESARHNLAKFPSVEVIEANFESWRPDGDIVFDLVFAATAWHWIDPAVRYRKAWELLAPDGHLAFWDAMHAFPRGGDPFFKEIQRVYDEIGEKLQNQRGKSLDEIIGTEEEKDFFPAPDELPNKRAEIEASGLFGPVEVRHFDWETIHDAESYIRLLNTFSGHIAMDAWKRDRLYGEVRRRLAERADGRLRRHWGAVLHVARKKPWTSRPK
jgi:SAM-dependent methyltransferase